MPPLRHEAGANLHGFIDGQQVFEMSAATRGVGDIELPIGSMLTEGR